MHLVRRGCILLRCGSACAIAALLGRFLPRLGPLAIASGPFFLSEEFCIKRADVVAGDCLVSPGLFVVWHPDSLGPIATSVIKQDLVG
ncbi:hypothetical protein CIW50_18230 [Tardiphaga sp. P9-11]|nr:hypothetical protein CIW50_18230 [Tardiphaga sp. P9-11]